MYITYKLFHVSAMLIMVGGEGYGRVWTYVKDEIVVAPKTAYYPVLLIYVKPQTVEMVEIFSLFLPNNTSQ